MKRTTAPNSVGGAYVDKVAGVTIGTTLVAEDRNNLQEEVCETIEGAGITLDGGDTTQLYQAIMALIYSPGVYVHRASEVAASVLFPALRIDDADHDISDANWPDLVPYLRAIKLESDGETDFAVNVAAGVATFDNDDPENRLLAALAEEILVQGGYNLALNLGGTDYAITNVNAGARTITVAAPPGNGAYTAIVYAYRITGSSTTARVRRMSGRALVGTEAESGDTPDRMLIAGLRARDRGQGHWHPLQSAAAGATAVPTYTGSVNRTIGSSDGTNVNGTVVNPVTDGVNGTPRTGATTEPRTGVAFLYMGGGRYIP